MPRIRLVRVAEASAPEDFNICDIAAGAYGSSHPVPSSNFQDPTIRMCALRSAVIVHYLDSRAEGPLDDRAPVVGPDCPQSAVSGAELAPLRCEVATPHGCSLDAGR